MWLLWDLISNKRQARHVQQRQQQQQPQPQQEPFQHCPLDHFSPALPPQCSLLLLGLFGAFFFFLSRLFLQLLSPPTPASFSGYVDSHFVACARLVVVVVAAVAAVVVMCAKWISRCAEKLRKMTRAKQNERQERTRQTKKKKKEKSQKKKENTVCFSLHFFLSLPLSPPCALALVSLFFFFFLVRLQKAKLSFSNNNDL